MSGIRDHFDLTPALRELAARWFFELPADISERDLLRDLLPQVGGVLRADFTAVVKSDQGRWLEIAVAGAAGAFPADLLGDALDAEGQVASGPWRALSLDPRSSRNELLVVHVSGSHAGLEEALSGAARLVRAAIDVVRERCERGRRLARLEAILAIAGQWNRTQEMDRLLLAMAEASTRLMQAERASIFLWDRPNRTLVGRPALGVPAGELRIPDDKGVVGRVVHTGQSLRVNERDDQTAIDRRVDRQLGFRTRSLLCVPLRGRSGELFGAFELINRVGGDFTADDEAALAELAGHAAVALENTQQREQLVKVRNQMADRAAEGVQLVGKCPAIEALRSQVRRIADTDLAVLLLGENGTGKEVVSQSIHYWSRRRHDPFVAVNCAALPETLLESELFGHEKGAFTDARETRVGKFELASGGTLLLDEIGDMSPGGQAKLLRVLEDKVVVRVGGSRPLHTDARVIAATNQNLADLVRQKKFREDLYYRLNVVTLALPPLRERGEDVLLLADHFLQEFSAKARRKPPQLTAEATKRLLGHAWPGNVRELRNLMERIVYLTAGDKVEAGELAFILSPRGDDAAFIAADLPLAEATHEFQIQYIRRQLARCRGT